jgi:menaquinone-dependent protoporphyrinogen oxidase
MVAVMSNILIVYATTDGHTLRICQRIQSVVELGGHRVTLVPVQEVGTCAVENFDSIVVGASIRYGTHSPLIQDFVQRHHRVLDSKPNAFFSVNVVARKPDKNLPDTNPYLKMFLKQITWQPRLLAVFAGKINYPVYKTMDRLMIRLIMWMTKGPTERDAVVEFTDWASVENFGREIMQMQQRAQAK